MARRVSDPPVLLVEDRTLCEPACCARRSETRGHEVLEARDQSEAVPVLRSGRPRVVLSDLRPSEGATVSASSVPP